MSSRCAGIYTLRRVEDEKEKEGKKENGVCGHCGLFTRALTFVCAHCALLLS